MINPKYFVNQILKKDQFSTETIFSTHPSAHFLTLYLTSLIEGTVEDNRRCRFRDIAKNYICWLLVDLTFQLCGINL